MSANNGLQGSANVVSSRQRDIDARKARTENPDLTWQRIAAAGASSFLPA